MPFSLRRHITLSLRHTRDARHHYAIAITHYATPFSMPCRLIDAFYADDTPLTPCHTPPLLLSIALPIFTPLLILILFYAIMLRCCHYAIIIYIDYDILFLTLHYITPLYDCYLRWIYEPMAILMLYCWRCHAAFACQPATPNDTLFCYWRYLRYLYFAERPYVTLAMLFRYHFQCHLLMPIYIAC